MMDDKMAVKYGITLMASVYLGIVAIKNKQKIAALQKENAKITVENFRINVDNVLKEAKIRELEAKLKGKS